MVLGLVLAALLSFTASAQEGSAQIGCFAGLSDSDTPATLSQCDSPDLLNVESNLGGTAILKRKGFTNVADLSCATCPVTGSHSFVDTANNRLDIICQDRYCLKSTNGNAPTAFLTTAASSATRWSFVDQAGILYGANNAYDPIISYDGTTLSRPEGMPQGSILELTPDRLAVADIRNLPNRVHLSSAGYFQGFTTGLEPEDSYFDDVGSPGDRVRGLKHLNGVLYIFKTASLTACELGDQYTTRCSVISSNLGTSEPASIITAGSALYFRSTDKNYWELSNSGLRQISRKIPNLVKSQSGGAGGGGNTNTQTTQADWQAGVQDPLATFNTASLPGSIFPSSFTLTDASSASFSLGSQNKTGPAFNGGLGVSAIPSSYTVRYDGNALPTAEGWSAFGTGGISGSVSGGTLTVTSTDGGIGGYQFAISKDTNTAVVVRAKRTSGGGSVDIVLGNAAIRIFGSDETVYFKNWSGAAESIATVSDTNTNFSTYTILITSGQAVSYWQNGVFIASATMASGCGAGACLLQMRVSNTASLLVDFFYYSTHTVAAATTADLGSGVFTSRIIDSGFETSVSGPMYATGTIPSGTSAVFYVRTSTSPNNDLWSSFVQVSTGFRVNIVERYWQYKIDLNQTSYAFAPWFSDVAIQAASTGTFRTQCIQPNSAINAWGSMSCAESLAGNGSLVYYATSAASCATLPSTPPTEWQTSVTNNATLSIDTNTAVYIGWRSLLGSATDQAQIDACTLAWNEGTPTQPAWAVYDSVKNAIFWTTTIDNASSANRLLKYDLNLDSWYPWDIPAQAPRIINNSLYFGGASSGTWNRYGLVDSDNGGAINAYWTSKDVGADQPFNEKDFKRASVLTRNNQAGSLTATWTLSNAKTGSYSISLSTGPGITYARSVVNLPKSSPQNFVSIRFGNNSTTPFEILGVGIGWTILPWRVSGP